MFDYKIERSTIEVKLENGQKESIDRVWVERSMKALDLDIESVIEMWLEDKGILENEEQNQLDKQAKGKVKLIAKNEKAKPKTQRERVQKENPTKELIIKTIAETLQNLDISNLNIENKGKIITFTMNNEDFKIDLVQKRKPKNGTK